MWLRFVQFKARLRSIFEVGSALEEILNHGLLTSLPAGGVHVSLSTISVDMAEKLKNLHKEHQQLFVSAPVFGRPEAAAAKKLWIVAAGEAAALARVKPVLEAIGQQTLEIGSAGNLTINAAETVNGGTLNVHTVAVDAYARIEGIMLYNTSASAAPYGGRKRYLRVVFTPAFTSGTGPAILGYAEFLGTPGNLAALIRCSPPEASREAISVDSSASVNRS